MVGLYQIRAHRFDLLLSCTTGRASVAAAVVKNIVRGTIPGRALLALQVITLCNPVVVVVVVGVIWETCLRHVVLHRHGLEDKELSIYKGRV
jgi:hypothetical protein